MNREEFLARLKSLLTGISEEERNEALQYYIDYFEDAGPEKEAEVIRELGSPEKLAAMIKADLKGNNTDSGEFTEHGYTDERFEEKESPACRETGKGGSGKRTENRYSYYNKASEERYTYSGENPKEYPHTEERRSRPYTSKWLKILLIVLIIFVAAPAVIPVFAVAVAVILAFICALFGVFAGIVIAAAAVAFAGICIMAVGIARFFVMPASAILSIGIGLMLLGAGAAVTAAGVKLCIVVYPALCRFLVNICRKPFHRKVVS